MPASISTVGITDRIGKGLRQAQRRSRTGNGLERGWAFAGQGCREIGLNPFRRVTHLAAI